MFMIPNYSKWDYGIILLVIVYNTRLQVDYGIRLQLTIMMPYYFRDLLCKDYIFDYN